MSDTLADYVLSNVDFNSYYQAEFPEWDGNHNTNVACPFSSKHASGKDKDLHFSININEKGGCFCHACNTRIGSIVHFEKIRHSNGIKLDDESAASRIYSRFVRPVLASPENVQTHLRPWENSLRGAPKILVCIKDEIQISQQTVERFDLGWESKTRRVTIPVIDKFNQLVNVRLYRLPSMRQDESFPKILNTDGYGSPAELFPIGKLSTICSGKHKPPVVYWMSGERDTLVAWDKGIPSFCYTTGENVCKKEWAQQLKKLNVIIGIVQDNDPPNQVGDKIGEKGAKKRLQMLETEGIVAFIVKLPEETGKDFSDYIKAGGKVKDFLSLGRTKKTTKEKVQVEQQYDPEEDYEFYPIQKIFDPSKSEHQGEVQVFQIGRRPDILNKPVTCKAIVSGKMDRTYSVPDVVQLGDHQYQMPICREMVQMVRCDETTIFKLFHGWLNTKAAIKIIRYMTVTEVEIIPMIQPGIDSPYVNQRCYYFGEHVECNKPYSMEIIPTTDMKTSENIGLIIQITPVSNVLDSYSFSKESYNLLKTEFGLPESMSCMDGLKTLAQQIAVNWSNIYNRDDLHLVAMLTWISPLQFEFPCEGLQRGWLNTLILGDTETGKSKVCQKLTKLFHCGVFINAESCSYVGLVGGAVKSSSGMFILRWGKIPLYNRQLVVVEELSGLTTQEISYMSEIRSAGVARYDKAGLTGETSAKTRLICLSNVRGEGKSLADYNTGVQAAQGLVGQNEDLARFDLILTATDDEAKGEVINKDRSEEQEEKFSEEGLGAFRELVMFAWSLKPEQIDFTVGAYRECLIQTMKLAGEYHSSLPVFKAGSGRLKLARIALSIACIQFSWDDEAKLLKVTAEHVKTAALLLHTLFRKPSFGYSRYSKIQFNLQKVLEPEQVSKKIKEVFKDKEMEFFQYIVGLAFTKFDLGEAMGVHFMFVERVISQMFLANMLKKGKMRGEWEISKAGRKWVESRIIELAPV